MYPYWIYHDMYNKKYVQEIDSIMSVSINLYEDLGWKSPFIKYPQAVVLLWYIFTYDSGISTDIMFCTEFSCISESINQLASQWLYDMWAKWADGRVWPPGWQN